MGCFPLTWKRPTSAWAASPARRAACSVRIKFASLTSSDQTNPGFWLHSWSTPANFTTAGNLQCASESFQEPIWAAHVFATPRYNHNPVTTASSAGAPDDLTTTPRTPRLET
jgi:hypothetical protein